jgi:molybdenum cofactor biosynthesis protein B
MLSFAEIGSAAMLSRAVAGVWGGRAVFSVPGSEAAVRLAWERLIGPELGHVIRELRKDARLAGR